MVEIIIPMEPLEDQGEDPEKLLIQPELEIKVVIVHQKGIQGVKVAQEVLELVEEQEPEVELEVLVVTRVELEATVLNLI